MGRSTWVVATALVACTPSEEVSPGAGGTMGTTTMDPPTTTGTSASTSTTLGTDSGTTDTTTTTPTTTMPTTTDGTAGSSTDPTVDPTTGSTSADTEDATSSTGGAGVGYRRPFTVSAGTVGEDLPGFVMAVVNPPGEVTLQHVDTGGHVVADDGSDLGFRDGAGSELPFELVAYNPTNGAFMAWVRVPTVAAAADTTIYLHYGDAASAFVPANPWTDYLAVYHFEDPLGNSNVADSGPGGIDGVASDLDGSDSVAGMVGRAFRFENGGDAVRVNSSTLGNGGPVTVVAWARLDGGDTGFPRIVHQGGFENRRMELYVEDGFGTSFGELTWRTNEDTDFGNTWLQATPPGFAFGDWHHYVGVADNVGTTMRLYYDGAQVASGSWDPPIDADDDTFIGNWDDGGGGTRNWVGAIDEVHFYDGVLGAAWVGAAFDNGTSPTTFSTMGPEQAL